MLGESDGKWVGSEMWYCEGWELWGYDIGHDNNSRAGGADGAWAFLVPARHNINMALRHSGAHGDNFGVQ